MRILHVIIGLDVGGAESMLYRLVTAGGDEDTHVVLSLSDQGEIGARLVERGYEVISLGLKTAFDIPRVAFDLIKVIKRVNPDILQTWMYHADVFAGFIGRVLQRPVVWGVRRTDVGVGVSRTTRVLQYFSAVVSHFLPTAIVAAAEASRSAHIDIGYRKNGFYVIPNGFDFKLNESGRLGKALARSKLGFAEADIVVGSVGRFNSAKNHQQFLMACIEVARCNSQVRFAFAGRNIDKENRILMDLIKESGFSNRFVFLGHCDKPSEIYEALDIFALHSISEGFPNVLVEAMAADVMCVTTDVGDAVDILNGFGIVAEGYGWKPLASALQQAISLPESERVAIAVAGGASVRDRFSIESSRRRYRALYSRVLS